MRAQEAMARASTRLQAAGVECPVVDARLLLTHLLGATHGLMTAPDPTDEQVMAFDQMLERRVAGEPVQHITGLAPFRYEELRVGPGVFIPRPETELLVEAALQLLAGRSAGQRRVVELCAGSGAITLSIARELGGVELHAVELSEAAWPFLKRNLEGVEVELVRGDMETAFHDLDGCVDLVVANPPYVPESERHLLPVDVLGKDPDLALFSGAQGLDALRVVKDVASRLLRPGGWVAAEHGESQESAVLEIFGAPEFEHTADFRDLSDRPRYVMAQRSLEAAGQNVAGLTT